MGIISGSANRAIVLLSGGIDSATTFAVAKEMGCEVHSLTFRYGQRHGVEIDAAEKVAQALGAVHHRIIDIDLRQIGHSALTSEIEVPKGRSLWEQGHSIPVTYVPARNTIFLSYALAWAEVLEAHRIFIGANARDYSGYPDCRPEYISAFEKMANLAVRITVEGGIKISIETPIIAMSKAEIIRLGARLGIDYSLTHSCYDPSPAGLACGSCDSCLIRRKGFIDAGIPDPTQYETLHSGTTDTIGRQ